MIRGINSEKPMYYVSSAGMEGVVIAGSSKEAASQFLRTAFEEHGDQFSLSPWIATFKCSESCFELADLEEYCSYEKTSEILADIGKHELSKSLEEIFSWN